jgi:hypothetical protein
MPTDIRNVIEMIRNADRATIPHAKKRTKTESRKHETSKSTKVRDFMLIRRAAGEVTSKRPARPLS